jgi:hypothetical protein
LRLGLSSLAGAGPRKTTYAVERHSERRKAGSSGAQKALGIFQPASPNDEPFSASSRRVDEAVRELSDTYEKDGGAC